VDAAAGGPWNVLGDVAALAVAIEALAESKPDTAPQCKRQKKKCKEATPQNIRSALAQSNMKTLQPSISAAVVQAYVLAIEMESPIPEIKVDDDVIVDGNHRYTASLLCNIIPVTRPYTRPLSLVPIPVQQLRIDP
jgi:hypothetical protein